MVNMMEIDYVERISQALKEIEDLKRMPVEIGGIKIYPPDFPKEIRFSSHVTDASIFG